MTTLYNLRTDGDEYRITKFIDGNVESTYLCTETECECPAGHRASCRHRQMLPSMLAHQLCNTHWFWDFDHNRVVDFEGNHLVAPLGHALRDQPLEPHSPTVTTTDFDSVDDGSIPSVAATKPAHSWRRI